MRRVPSSLWPSSSAPSSENVDESVGAVEKGSEVNVMEYSRCQGSPSGREARSSARTSKRPSKSRLCRAKIRDDVKQKRPICVVGCPPCTVFSVSQSANQNKDSPEFKRQYGFLGSARKYGMQADAGRFYIHEHQVSASSWKIDSMKTLDAE